MDSCGLWFFVVVFFFFPQATPLPSLHLVTRIWPWLAQTVGALSWTGRVWQDAPGCRQPLPRLALLLSSVFRDELPGDGEGLLRGPSPTLGERVLLQFWETAALKSAFRFAH